MNTPLDFAIEAAGLIEPGKTGLGRISSACGISYQSVQKLRNAWRETGQPPRAIRDHAAAIERACGGAVRAEQLYPDVQWMRDASGAITHYAVPVGAANDGDELPAATEAA